jgi:peroxin-1
LHILSSGSAETIPVSFEPSSGRAVLLANDTELSVAPKTRRQQNSVNKHFINGETPVVKSDSATERPSDGGISYSVLLRVLPASVFPHHLPSPSNFTSVIYVSEQMLKVARLEGSLPSDSNTTIIGNVKRLAPPTDPAGATNPSPPDAPAVAKVLNPSEATKREDAKEEQSKDVSVRVIGLDGLLGGQIVIVGGVDDVEDWDVVR